MVKSGENGVNLNTYCYSAWKDETGEIGRSRANITYSGCPRTVVSAWAVSHKFGC